MTNTLRVILLLMAFAAGCAGSRTSTDPVDPYGDISYNVVLRTGADAVMSQCQPGTRVTSIETSIRPVLLPATSTREPMIRVIAVCSGSRAPVTYEFPYHRVEVILETSSPRVAPDSIRDLTVYTPNCRERIGWGPFDKLELRGVVGYRGDKDSVFYPSASGGEIYRSSTFGNSRGGSSIIAGVEIAALWSFAWLDETERLQLGLMTGWWPVDESQFIPIGIKARYTVDQRIVDDGSSGSTLYLFGDAGLPLDFTTNAGVIGPDVNRQRIYYGFGAGFDWPIGCTIDFSIDLALRRMTLPLPPIDCCPDIPDEERNPYRTSNAVVLRTGLTF